jgi:hypothetical protein
MVRGPRVLREQIMVGVAKSTLPTRTVGEVLARLGRKSMRGSGFVRPEYFANPCAPLARYSPRHGLPCPGRFGPGGDVVRELGIAATR